MFLYHFFFLSYYSRKKNVKSSKGLKLKYFIQQNNYTVQCTQNFYFLLNQKYSRDQN